MQNILQEMCLKLKDGSEYKFKGTDINGLWQNGKLETANGANSYEVANGIPRFVKPEDETWGTEEKIKESTQLQESLSKIGITYKELIEWNFEKSYKDEGLYDYFKSEIDLMLKPNGIILECACGPGGGFSPYFLKSNPDAKIIMNDKSFWILNEWYRLNQKKAFGNLSFSLFDLTDSPFADNSFDMISSWFGVSNIAGNTQLGLNECYRTLKKGGKLFMTEVEISAITIKAMNSQKLTKIKNVIENNERFGMGTYDCIIRMIEENLKNQAESAGFINVNVVAFNSSNPDPTQGDIPAIFHEAGIELIYDNKKFLAEK